MKAMIFAAGLGTRLKPLTDTMPKALVPLAGKPLLQWQVERLRDAGITDIIVNVHHFPDMIIETIRRHDGWGCHIEVSDEREALLDTGGGLRKVKDERLKDEEPILACNVDILSNIDLKTLVEEYNKLSSLQGGDGGRLGGLLVVSERPTQRYLCFDEQDLLCGWTNIATGEQKGKDGRHLAFSGMQVLSPAIFSHLDRVAAQKGNKFSLIDLYLSICEANLSPLISHPSPLLKAYVPNNYRMMDVGKIDQIAEAEAFAESLQGKK